MNEQKQTESFKWACLAMAVLFGVVLLWMIADFKQKMVASLFKAESTISKVEESVDKVNLQIPEMLVEIRQTSQTLSGVAKDVELMKEVAGIASKQTNGGVRELALYAKEVQQILSEKFAGKEGNVLVEEVFGSDLHKEETLQGFLVGLSKEMVLSILPLSNSKEEILFRICHNGIRKKPFYVQFEGAEPQKLEDLIREHHPASQELKKYDPKKK